MRKFSNSKYEEEQIEKLKQEQLIKSILNRPQLEIQALIQATIENSQKSYEDIEKIKNDIVKSEMKKQDSKNEEEINVKIYKIRQAQAKIKQNNKTAHIKEQRIDKYKTSKNIVKKIFRKENTTNLEKKQVNLKRNNKYKKELIEFLDKQKTKKKEKINKKSKASKLKQKIPKFKLLKGINAYKKNMRYYFEEEVGSKFDKIIGDMRHKNVKSKKENFAKTLYQTINHKKAYEEAEKNSYIKEEYEYKLI